MKYTIAAAALVALVNAQATDLSGLPECAKSCLSPELFSKTGCPTQFDIACICRSDAFITEISCCVSKNCQGSDIDMTIQFADSICAAASVNLPTMAACSGAAASEAPSASPAPPGDSSMSMTASASMGDATAESGMTSSEGGSAGPQSTNTNAAPVFGSVGGAAGVAAVFAALL